jgi:hypothetical protein
MRRITHSSVIRRAQPHLNWRAAYDSCSIRWTRTPRVRNYRHVDCSRLCHGTPVLRGIRGQWHHYSSQRILILYSKSGTGINTSAALLVLSRFSARHIRVPEPLPVMRPQPNLSGIHCWDDAHAAECRTIVILNDHDRSALRHDSRIRRRARPSSSRRSPSPSASSRDRGCRRAVRRGGVVRARAGSG